jgi:F-type H+-transporting ATPase subunit delta
VKALRQDPPAVDRGLTLLRAVCPVIASIRASGGRGEPSGTAAAKQLETILRSALKEAGVTGTGGGSAGREAGTEEITIRFLLLLVRRGLFGRMDGIIERIGMELDKLRGFLQAGLESPFPPEEGFRKDLEGKLAGKTGAKGVTLEVKIVPDLLGGYRLRIGSEVIDASLRALLKKMETDLAAVYIPGEGGALEGVPPSHGGL